MSGTTIMRILVAIMVFTLLAPLNAQIRPKVFEDLIAAEQALREADGAQSRPAEEALLRQARDLLEGIVVADPNGVIAHQLQTGGVATIGGSDLSLVGVENRLHRLCFREPTADCLCGAALDLVVRMEDPLTRDQELYQSVYRLSTAGCLEEARRAVAAIQDPQITNTARERLIQEFTSADRFDEALQITEQLPAGRLRVQESIAWRQIKGNAVSGSFATIDRLRSHSLEPEQKARVDDLFFFASVVEAAKEVRFEDAWSYAYGIVSPELFPEALVRIAKAQKALGDKEAALQTLDESRAVSTEMEGFDRYWLLMELARSYIEIDRRDEAGSVLSDVLSGDFDLTGFEYQEVATLHAQIGRFSEAIDVADRIDPPDFIKTQTISVIAAAMKEAGEADRARNLLQEAWNAYRAGRHHESTRAEIVFGQVQIGMLGDAEQNAVDLSIWSRYRINLAIAKNKWENGASDDAKKLIEYLIQHISQISRPSSRVRMLGFIAQAQCDMGFEQAAAETVRRAASLSSSIEDGKSRAYELGLLAKTMRKS